jgi:zinc transport system ATP-binding protein
VDAVEAVAPSAIKHPRIGFVPQRMAFDRSMPLTVLEFLSLRHQRRPIWLGISSKVRSRVLELLAAVQAEHLVGRGLGNLSGGELQRVLLANALARDPDLLILDEPASGVDVQGEQLFCELLEAVAAKYGFTQLMVSHDLSTVIHHATHVICLNKTVVAEGTPRVALNTQNLLALFGIHMGLVDEERLGAHVEGKCH